MYELDDHLNKFMKSYATQFFANINLFKIHKSNCVFRLCAIYVVVAIAIAIAIYIAIAIPAKRYFISFLKYFTIADK